MSLKTGLKYSDITRFCKSAMFAETKNNLEKLGLKSI